MPSTDRGKSTPDAYEDGLRAYIDDAVAFQEEIGLDVLVHGEPERNDMVEYFGEMLTGCHVTNNGWVQSYGSRCVKPPIIFGDISRPRPMTVEWTVYAQSRTRRPLKGMLTGPTTILQWSFVRNDQPHEVTARQIAFAIRDEVADLEAAGIKVVQIDEPAFREGLPLHAAERKDYLAWAVAAFKLASSGVRDETQVHTHMCYAEFNDIIESIAAFDADVISIEASRSADGASECLYRFRVPERGRSRALRHPLATRPGDLRDGGPLDRGPGGGPRRPALGEPGLRAQDPALGRGAPSPRQYGGRRPCGARSSRGSGTHTV